MNSQEPGARAAAAAAYLKLDTTASGPAHDTLRALLEDIRPQNRALAIGHLEQTIDILPSFRLQALLRDPSPVTRSASMEAAAARGGRDFLVGIVGNLDDPRTAGATRSALRRFPEESVVRAIGSAYPKPGTYVIRALADFSGDSAVALLIGSLDDPQPESSAQTASALLAIAGRQPLARRVIKRAFSQTATLVHGAYVSIRLLRLLPLATEAGLLRDHFEESIRATIPALIRLKSLTTPALISRPPSVSSSPAIRRGCRLHWSLSMTLFAVSLLIGGWVYWNRCRWRNATSSVRGISQTCPWIY